MTSLHLDLGRQWRGGQNQVLLLLRGLRARGHAAELVAVESSPLARRAQAEGFPVHTVGGGLPRLHASLRLRQMLTERTFDIVHAHEAHALTAAWLARARRRSCLVASRRVAYRLGGSPLAQARYRAARRILAVSRFVAESVVASGLPAEQVEVVYDGIEIPPLPSPEERRRARQRWGVEGESPLLGCVGYLLPEKGQETLIRALPAVRAEFPTCRLLLAGDGPCRDRLERLAQELGVEPAVCFAGVVEEVAQVYAALDVFVFPSLAEPLGSSLLAAMGFALPAVAVGRGAVPEVVEDGRSGLLVSEPDPRALAAAVGRLLRDPELARRLGQAARAVVEQRFSADQMVEKTLAVYQQTCSPGGCA